MSKRESFLHSIGAAVFWKAGEKLTGLAKHVVVAAVIGLSSQLDVFYMAMALLGMLVLSWAQLLDVIAVPRLVEYHRASKFQEFQALAGGLFSLCLIISIVLTVAVLVGSSLLAKAAIGFDADRKQLLAEAFIWLAPMLLLSIPLQFIASVFRSIRRFSIYYQAQFIIAAAGLVLIILFREHSTILLWSYSGGVTLAFIYLTISARKLFKLWGNPFSKDILDVWKMAPGLFMLQISQNLYVLADKIFTSFLSRGGVGALAYGRNLAYVAEGMLGFRGSFITIFSEVHGSQVQKQKIFNDILSFSIFIAVPINIFLLFFGHALIVFFLERGLFSSLDSNMVFAAVAGYCWGLLPFVMIGPMEQIFQVQKRVDLLVKGKVVGLTMNCLLNAIFLFVLKMGILGIALATSLSLWIVLAWSIVAAAKTGLSVEAGQILKWSGWIVSASLLGALVAKFSTPFTDWLAIVFQVIIFAGIIIVAAGTYRGSEGYLVRQTIRRVNPFIKKSDMN